MKRSRESPYGSFISFVYHTAIHLLPPRARVILEYLRAHRRWPNLKNPQTLNEKITWRKLYDRDPRMPDLVDKIKAAGLLGLNRNTLQRRIAELKIPVSKK